MKLNKIIVAAGAAMALCVGVAHAGDASTITETGGTIHFKGKLTSAPCSVSTDSDGQTVELGEYTTHHFNASGIKGTEKPFQIKLEDCDVTTYTTAAVAFSGRQDADNESLLAVDSGLSGDQSATATGVGIQILDGKSQVVKPDGSSFSTEQTLNDGENILNFAAQYVSTAAATAGEANADATFIMQYN
ncbi:type 1 fimbrial major subunit FimA [Gibbsiella dentisursi]|uniref:Type 1 fimbrial major subunit FimA n=1 Tax=Gibbsiella dentisursi TaxID=796890 RepID=A0ABP7LAI6_9GAMM